MEKYREKQKKKEELGVRIFAACRNELYASYPYLDGAFASLSCVPFEEITGIGTDDINIFFHPDFLLNN